MAKSNSDGVAIRYVGLLPVLLITSCFYAMGPMGQNQARRLRFTPFSMVAKLQLSISLSNKKHLKNVGPVRHCEPPHDDNNNDNA